MLVDTSGWLCILDERDERHRTAVDLFNSSRTLITHSYIIAELVPLCQSRRFSRIRTLNFLDELVSDPTIEILWLDVTLTRQGINLLASREDKRWSLCDAVSFIIMNRYGISDALTTDHHFEQAGFVRLLES